MQEDSYYYELISTPGRVFQFPKACMVFKQATNKPFGMSASFGKDNALVYKRQDNIVQFDLLLLLLLRVFTLPL